MEIGNVMMVMMDMIVSPCFAARRKRARRKRRKRMRGPQLEDFTIYECQGLQDTGFLLLRDACVGPCPCPPEKCSLLACSCLAGLFRSGAFSVSFSGRGRIWVEVVVTSTSAADPIRMRPSLEP